MTYPSWTHQGRIFNDITDFPEDTYGFIYEVTHQPTGLKYLGKKVLYFNRTLPPLKGQKRKRKVVKESDWKDYYGSHPKIKEYLKECKDTNEWRVWEKKILDKFYLDINCSVFNNIFVENEDLKCATNEMKNIMYCIFQSNDHSTM